MLQKPAIAPSPLSRHSAAMTGSLHSLFAAAVFFVGSHFLLSSAEPRRRLVALIGAQGFLAAYSLVALAAFVWMILAYRAAPFEVLWTPPPALGWIPLLIMPLAAILVAAGASTPSLTAVGGERLPRKQAVNEAVGIQTVTRHPVLWGIALWALSHLAIRGDLASMTLFISILVLAAGGMHHIDLRRERELGADWGPIKLTTSILPFGAVLQGRTTLDWAGIGWQRVAMGLAVYLALLFSHGPILGVTPHPY